MNGTGRIRDEITRAKMTVAFVVIATEGKETRKESEANRLEWQSSSWSIIYNEGGTAADI